MADLGYIALVLALTLSAYGIVAPVLGVHFNNWNLVRSTQWSMALTFALTATASAVLIHGFIISDFSIAYVYGHSSSDMPLFYKVTAFWGGMDGSLLLWALVQSFFAAIVAFRYQYTNRQIIPYVLTTLNFILLFLFVLLVGWSNPLAPQLVAQVEGRGLNPLLQNPGMVIHPPSLYLGYIGFSIPFAFALGGLMRGQLGIDWIMTTRRWTLMSWFFLTLGLILGGQWAYEELGWGGYWAWDPVENAAFMPWLTGTAFLHSVMIQEKRNMLKVWNIVLIMITFALSILGTFLTRSGIVNSVHSFAQSEIGPAFLAFLAFMLLFTLTFLFRRLSILESEHTMESVFCKENAFLAQNVMFLGIAFTVLLGTTFPLLAEAVRGTKLSIQAPFFNTVTAPMGYLLFFLMGVGTLIAWRRSSLDNLRKNFLKPILIASLAMPILLVFVSFKWEAYLIFWIAFFVLSTIAIELVKATQIKCNQLSVSWPQALILVVARNSRRYGGLLIHFGVVLMFLGFAGNFYKHEKDITLLPGQPKTINNYTFNFTKVDEFAVLNATHRAALIEVTRNGKPLETLKPAKSYYPTQPEPLTEVEIRRFLFEDLYVVFASENVSDNSVTLKVYINPMVGFAWAALPIFVLGVGLSMTYRTKSLAVRKEFSRAKYSLKSPLQS